MVKRQLVLRFDHTISTANVTRWLISRERRTPGPDYPNHDGHVLWEVPGPCGLLGQPIFDQNVEFVITYIDRDEDHHQFTVSEYPLFQELGTCWAQDYRLDRVLQVLVRQMRLHYPGASDMLRQVLFNWLFYPKTPEQVLSLFEPGGERL